MEHYAAEPLMGMPGHCHAANQGVTPMGLPGFYGLELDGLPIEPLSRAHGAAPAVAMQLPLIAMVRPA